MRKLWLLAAVATLAVGCGNSYPLVRQQGSISTVTFPVAFGNYSRVYNTTYQLVNRYAVIRRASYKQGVIEAELSQDTSLFEKTRRTVLARLFDTGDYWDVECRVLIEVEDSDIETFGEAQPRYKWRTIAYDQFLETRLNNEIKAALTGGAWASKAPLKYKGVAALSAPKGVRFRSSGTKQHNDSASKANKTQSLEKVLEKQKQRLEKEDSPRSPREISASQGKRGLNAREYERLGVHYLQQGQYGKAENAFQSALAADSSSVAAPFLKAHAYFAQGLYNKAATALQQGFAKNADWEKANIDIRSFYSQIETFKGQVEVLKRHVESNKKDQNARMVLAWVQYHSGQYRDAKDNFAVVSLAESQNDLASHYLKRSQVQVALTSGTLREF